MTRLRRRSCHAGSRDAQALPKVYGDKLGLGGAIAVRHEDWLERLGKHQVALPPGHNARESHYWPVHNFCEGLSVCPRRHAFQRDHEWYAVFCFAEKEHADRFAAQFNGEYMTPQTRPPYIEKRKRTQPSAHASSKPD